MLDKELTDNLRQWIWTSPRGVEVILPDDLERHVFTESEFVMFKRFMHGQTVMMVNNGSAYYVGDIIKFVKILSEKPTE